MKRKHIGGAAAWTKYRKGRSGAFVYNHRHETIKRLCDTERYGVVQLVCVENSNRAAYMAGYRAGRRSKP